MKIYLSETRLYALMSVQLFLKKTTNSKRSINTLAKVFQWLIVTTLVFSLSGLKVQAQCPNSVDVFVDASSGPVNLSSLVVASGDWDNMNIAIDGQLNIDMVFEVANAFFCFNDNSSIQVFEDFTVTACSFTTEANIWNGIIVNDGATLDIQDCPEISNASVAIHYEGCIGCGINVQNNSFFNNEESIVISNTLLSGGIKWLIDNTFSGGETGIRIEDCTGESNTDIRIQPYEEDVVFSQLTQNGIVIEDCDVKFRIQQCDFVQIGILGIVLKNCPNIDRIRQNNFEDIPMAIRGTNIGVFSMGFNGNTIKNVYTGIRLEDGETVDLNNPIPVVGNVMEDFKIGIITINFEPGAADINIENNSLSLDRENSEGIGLNTVENLQLISDNTITTTNGEASRGIVLFRAANTAVFDNSIEGDKNSSKEGNFIALELTESFNCEVSSNRINYTDIYMSHLPTEIGISVTNSFDNIYCCNLINKCQQGIRFEGNCNPSILSNNTLGLPNNNGTGLGIGFLLVDAVIGEQENQANDWQHSDAEVDAEIRANNLNEVAQSAFISNPSLIPGIIEVNDLTGNTPIGVPTDWFTFMGTEIPECDPNDLTATGCGIHPQEEDPPCFGFSEEEDFLNWQTWFAGDEIQTPGPDGNTDTYMEITDGSGPSWFFNSDEMSGDWTADYLGDCICFHFKLVDDLLTETVPVNPTISIYRGDGDVNDPDLSATFTAYVSVDDNDDWVQVCAPIELCDDQLPANDHGSWAFDSNGNGATCTEWEDLLSSITGVRFSVEYVDDNGGGEIIGFDNICIQECEPAPHFDCIPMPGCNNGGFENINGCTISPNGCYQYAFNLGCVQGWNAANGSPDVCTDASPFSPYEGNHFAQLGASFSSNGECRNEAIYKDADFNTENSYELSFHHRTGSYSILDEPLHVNVYLTNGLIPNTNSTMLDYCSNIDLSNSQLVFENMTFQTNDWEPSGVISFTPTGEFDQLLFVPVALTSNVGTAYWLIDGISIKECDPDCIYSPTSGFENTGYEEVNGCTISSNGCYSHAFNLGCVADWKAANGSPDVCTEDSAFPPYEGKHFAQLGASSPSVGIEMCENEAIYNDVNFTPGVSYELSFHHRTGSYSILDEPLHVRVYLTSGLTANTTSTSFDHCSNIDLSNSQLVFENAMFQTNDWEHSGLISFTSNDNFDQLLFVPVALASNIGASYWLLDAVQLEQCNSDQAAEQKSPDNKLLTEVETPISYKIFPNPTQGEMTLQLHGPDNLEVSTEIYTAEGKLVKVFAKETYPEGRYQKQWIPESDLARGLYYVVFKTNYGTYHEKVIVNDK